MKKSLYIKNSDRDKKLITWGIGALLIVCAVFFFLFFCSKKEVWFCDEIYTFQSANGMEQGWPDATKGKWISAEEMEAFFAADSKELSLKWISDSLYNDHVPLYFWLYRVVAFFLFKGSATLWTGYCINLLFYILFLGIAYKFFCDLTSRPMLSAGIVLVSSIINRVMLAQTTILRMYMMLVLAELLLLLIGFKLVKDKEQGRLKATTFLGLFVFSVFGFLTHYDYWIFYAMTAAVFCAWLLLLAFKKQKGKFLKTLEFRFVLAWVGNFVAALLSTILIFPYCRWNLNKGKGQTALHSIFVFSSKKVENILWGFERLSISLFGEKLPGVIGIVIIFGGIFSAIVLLKKRKEYFRVLVMTFVTLIPIGYQLIVCFTMPDLNEERYLWGAFTMIQMCFVWSVYLCTEALVNRFMLKKKQVVAGVAVACLTLLLSVLQLLSINGGSGVPYLFHPQKDVGALEAHDNVPWVVYGPIGSAYSYYDWLIPQEICFLSEEHTEEDVSAVAELQDDGSFIVYCLPEYLTQAMAFFEQELNKELESEWLTNSTQLSVYVMKEKN